MRDEGRWLLTQVREREGDGKEKRSKDVAAREEGDEKEERQELGPGSLDVVGRG